MKTLRFKLKGRRAYLQNMKYADKLKAVFSYAHPGARFIPTYNMRKEDGTRLWDGRVSMVRNGSLDVGLLIGAYKELKDAGFKARIIKWKKRPKVDLKDGGFWEKSQSYEYQNQACQEILNSLSKGGGICLSATGTGKTKLSAQVFSHIKGRCLFIVDQLNLLTQSQKELETWLKEKVGIVGGGVFSPNRVTVCTIQTLTAHRNKPHFKKWIKGGFDVMMIDELHKQMSKRNFGIITVLEPQAVIGLTATLQMKKKQIRWKVYSIAGPIIFEFPISEGQAAGVLSKAAVVQVQVPHKLNSVLYDELSLQWNGDTGDYEIVPVPKYDELVICNKNVTHQLVPNLVKEALHEGLAVIVLGDRITHLRILAKTLSKMRPTSLMGATKKHKRESTIRRFERSKISLIIASRIFTKGINIKRISLIIDVAELSNRDDAMQKLGRGVRLHEEKSGLIYIDVTTSPENKKAGSSRRNTFKKAGIPLKILDATEVSAKEIIRCAKKMIKSTKNG